jgi:hypothetical protein
MKGARMKIILNYLWNEARGVLYLLLASLAIVIFMIIFATTSHAESFEVCTARCKADVMDINQCIEDERQHWDTHVSKLALKNACMDLIRNEKLNCHSDCEKERYQNEAAMHFYDINVKNFPYIND